MISSPNMYKPEHQKQPNIGFCEPGAEGWKLAVGSWKVGPGGLRLERSWGPKAGLEAGSGWVGAGGSNACLVVAGISFHSGLRH